MKLYIVRVYEDGDVLEYEYGNLASAKNHMAIENAMCMLTEYVNGTELLIECKAERGTSND